MHSSIAQSIPQRNIPPPVPTPSEDRFFTDWSSNGSRSPPGALLAQNIPLGETTITHGVGDTHEVEQGQATQQTSQPAAIPTIVQGSSFNATGQAILMEPPLSHDTHRQPSERSNMPEEELVSVIGPNTSDVVTDPAVGILRIQQVKVTTQISAPPSEVIIPPIIGDNIAIPHISLSASGYEPDSLRTLGIRSPPVRTQEISMIPQLDGPRSLPTRDPVRERMGRLPDQIEQDPSQEGTYVQKVTVSRRREYSEEGDNSDDYRRLHWD